MGGFKKTTFARVGSWLLALAIVVTSITLPQSAVNAEEVTLNDEGIVITESVSGDDVTSDAKASVEPETLANDTFTLYYYCEGMTASDVLYLNIWNWKSLGFQESTPQGKYIDCSNCQGKFVEVSGNPGWYSINLSLTESTEDDGFSIYKTDSDTKLYDIDNAYNNTNDYVTLTSGTYSAYAVKDYTLYTDLAAAGLDFSDDKPYTINVYENDFSNDSALNDFTQSGTDGVDEALVKEGAWHFWSNSTVTTVKATHEVTGLTAGDYYLSFTARGENMTESTAGISVGSSSQQMAITYGVWATPATNTTDLLTLSNNGDITIEMSYGLGAGSWCDIDDLKLVKKVDAEEKAAYEFSKLTEMIEECKAMDPSEYSETTWSDLQNVLTEAKALTENSSIEDIMAAQSAIKAAKAALKDAGIWVKKVDGLSENFIRGVDISSYVSVTESGATFKDEEGNVLNDKEFFTLLKNSGINYVRIRVWNNPYMSDGSGKGYGGGNNDLEKAKKIGKLATDEDMGVLIDFHYSDFWADPERQYAPKAWKNMNISEKETALYDYTLYSLTALREAGVNVTMVQVGNETNNGIAGEDHNDGNWTNMCKLFSAGSRAVRAFDQDVLVAVHFTDPQTIGNYDKIAKQLDAHNVDYDIFASSYYPNIHGSMENITNVLKKVADTYHKKVMVAETAWANTTNDGDGHSQSFDVGSDPDYTISVQGQANVIRDVVQAVHNIGSAGIGVFVWEPTWIPVQYAYDENGKKIDSVYQSNQEAWRKYGSGWASEYSKEYDPEHGGKYHGGSVKDSEAFFDFNGNPLASLTIFKDVYTGRTGPSVKVEVVKHASVEVLSGNVEEAVKIMVLPATVTAIYNNSDRKEMPVTWNRTELNQITDFGSYTIKGVASLENGGTASAVCDITILPDTLLEQGDFEEGHDKWEIAGTQADLVWNDTPYRGEGAMHFWLGTAFDFTLTQSVKVQKSGIYKSSMVVQGEDSTGTDDITIQVINNTSKVSKTAKASLKGWTNWDKAVTDGIEAKAGDILTVTIRVKAGAGAWGSLDDVFLYLVKENDTSSSTSTQPINPVPKEETPKPVAEGTKLTVATGSFKVTSDAQDAPEVEFAAPASKKSKKVTIPATITVDGVTYKVTSIANKAFAKNKKLTTVKIGSNVTVIGSSAFSGCSALTKITIPKNVETIGSKAFYGCKKLKTITIKSSAIKKVGSKAFKGIKENATIKVPSKKLKTYKKLFKGKGQASTVEIKK